MFEPIKVKDVIEEANEMYQKVRGYPMQSFQIEAVTMALVNQVNDRLQKLYNSLQKREGK